MLVQLQNGSVKNQITKEFYYTHDLSKTAAAEYRSFIKPDGDSSLGANSSYTNWEGSDGKLPEGQEMEILKIGFTAKGKDGAVLTVADFAKLGTGRFKVQIGEREILAGHMGSLFPSPITTNVVITDIEAVKHSVPSPVVEIPLALPEVWRAGEMIKFTFRVEQAMTGDVQVMARILGKNIQ